MHGNERYGASALDRQGGPQPDVGDVCPGACAAPPASYRGSLAIVGGPTTVLVVDDDPHVRLMLRRLIGHFDGVLEWVGEAVDGYQALRRHAELKPASVLLDIMMPGLDGLTVARRLLTHDPALRIVLFSAAVDDARASTARQLGVFAVVAKTDIAALWSTLASLGPE